MSTSALQISQTVNSTPNAERLQAFWSALASRTALKLRTTKTFSGENKDMIYKVNGEIISKLEDTTDIIIVRTLLSVQMTLVVQGLILVQRLKTALVKFTSM